MTDVWIVTGEPAKGDAEGVTSGGAHDFPQHPAPSSHRKQAVAVERVFIVSLFECAGSRTMSQRATPPLRFLFQFIQILDEHHLVLLFVVKQFIAHRLHHQQTESALAYALLFPDASVGDDVSGFLADGGVL